MGKLRIFIGICIAVAITAVTWQLMMKYEASKHRSLLMAEAENTRDLVLHDLRLRILAIDRMAARLATFDTLNKRLFSLEARSYLRDMPGFFAIGWVDLDGILTMVQPEWSERLIGLNIKEFGQDRSDVFDLAARSSAFELSVPVELKTQNDTGFLGAKAVRRGVNQIGTLWVVFRSNEWISNLHFGMRRDDVAGVEMSIYLNGRNVYISENFDGLGSPVLESQPLTVAGNKVSVLIKDATPFAARANYLIASVVTALVGILSISAMIAGDALRRSRIQEQRAAAANTALTAANDQMTIEVAHRRKAERDAKRSSAAKAQFLSTMSHELRTPMNGVMGMTELLCESDLSVEQRDHANELGRSGEQLMTVLSDILDFANFDRGAVDLVAEPLDLRSAITNAVQFFVPQAEKKGLNMTLDIAEDVPEIASFDPARLRQIAINLVRNAVKFTHSGEILISVSTAQNPDLCLKLVIRDTGVGIPAAKLKEIFNEFQQVDGDASRQFDGAGLGLPIVDRLAKAMGGRIEVTSEVGVGSEFAVSLPLRETSTSSVVTENAGNKSQRADTLKGARLLVAEDNLTNQKIIAAFLKQSGCQLDMANDGQEAVDLFEQQSYDAVIMDVSMPNKNGYEATRIIRAMERNRADRLCPIIGFTANCGDEDQRKCREAGMDDVIAKPASKKELVGRLQTWLAGGPGTTPFDRAAA